MPWRQAVLLAAFLAVVGTAARRSGDRRVTAIGAAAREAATVLGLYSIWNYSGRISLVKVDGALARARLIWDLQRWLPLPRETAVQQALLPHDSLVQASNLYYAIVHVPALLGLLVWLFVRHRHRYRRWRNVLALTTLGCLLIQLVPVAPPRFLPELGFVDTGILYGQSVYGSLGDRPFAFDQLSAMPSVHVAWAVLVGVAIVAVSPSRHRWWWMLHPAITVAVVVGTGNHWWLDGIVAGVLIGLSFALLHGLSLLAPQRRRSEELAPV